MNGVYITYSIPKPRTGYISSFDTHMHEDKQIE